MRTLTFPDGETMTVNKGSVPLIGAYRITYDDKLIVQNVVRCGKVKLRAERAAWEHIRKVYPHMPLKTFNKQTPGVQFLLNKVSVDHGYRDYSQMSIKMDNLRWNLYRNLSIQTVTV